MLDPCLSLDVFRKDPEKEVSYFEDDRPQWGKGHSHTGASGLCEHEYTPNNEMEDGRNMPKKSDKEWASVHKAWKSRCTSVASTLKYGLVTHRPLLKGRYEELVEISPI